MYHKTNEEKICHSEGFPTKTLQHKTRKSYFAFLKSMPLEMKDPESIHSPNTEAVIRNYRWDDNLQTKFQAKENMLSYLG